MRAKDIVRISLLGCAALGCYFLGGQLQVAYSENPPYMYFWMGVVLEFVAHILAAVTLLYSLLRLGLAYSRHEIHWPTFR